MLKDIMTFGEAAEEWKLDSSTLRKLTLTDKLIKDVDYKKSKGTWIITRAAMLKVYGEPSLRVKK